MAAAKTNVFQLTDVGLIETSYWENIHKVRDMHHATWVELGPEGYLCLISAGIIIGLCKHCFGIIVIRVNWSFCIYRRVHHMKTFVVRWSLVKWVSRADMIIRCLTGLLIPTPIHRYMHQQVLLLTWTYVINKFLFLLTFEFYLQAMPTSSYCWLSDDGTWNISLSLSFAVVSTNTQVLFICTNANFRVRDIEISNIMVKCIHLNVVNSWLFNTFWSIWPILYIILFNCKMF